MAEISDAEAGYWLSQIETAEKDGRYQRWLSVGQAYYDRYRLESQNLVMHAGMTGRQYGRMIYNLLWSNTKTILPMLYSRLPEPYVSRRFNNRDPIARMASQIAERVVSVDLEFDDFDDQAESIALDYYIVGRGTLRAVYEHSTINSRIPVREENREEGEPRFVTEAGEEIPRDIVQNDAQGFFTVDPRTTNERAPLCYQHWKDFLIGPGRKWKEVQKHGWIAYRNFMTKPEVARRFGQEAANALSYTHSAFDLSRDSKDPTQLPGITTSLRNLAEVYEIWDARSRQIFWVAKDYTKLLDKQQDFLDLVGFFNTPRPLLSTFSNDTLVPVPDYAEYYTQAKEMDDATQKIEQIMEEVRAGGVYNAALPALGTALKNKRGGWHGVDEWQAFASSGGMDGAVQEFKVNDLVQAVISLYEHRQNVKKDADEIGGMIDLFRGQQTQKDETLGQSEIRSSMGGLRINDKQRDFQRYLRDGLAMKAEIIVSQFDDQRILEMADAQALVNQSPEVLRVKLTAQSPQFRQALQQDPNLAMQLSQALQQATSGQMQLIQAALVLLKSDRMRTFKLDIETDATVAVDEMQQKTQAREFVTTISSALNDIFASEAIASAPQLKPLAAEMLMFIVRQFSVGRSFEQKMEAAITEIVTAPPAPEQPDPLTLDVQRQAQKDQTDAALKAEANRIDKFEAETGRMKVNVDAAEAAQKATTENLKLVKDILDSDAVEGHA